MQKVSIIIYKNDYEKILTEIQDLGVFEVVDINKEKAEKTIFEVFKNESSEIDMKLAEIDFALRLIMPLSEVKKTFKEKVIGDSIFGTTNDVIGVMEKFDYKKVVLRCNEINEKINQNKSKLAKIEEEKTLLKNWTNLNFNLGIDRHSEHAEMRLGEMSTHDANDFMERASAMQLFNFQIVSQNPVHTYFLIVFHNEISEEVQILLDTFRFIETKFSEQERTPKEQVLKLDEIRNKLNNEIKDLNSELRKLSKNVHNLKFVYDYYLWEKEKYKAQEKALESKKTILLEGWVPIKKYNKLVTRVEGITKNIHITKIEPEKGEMPPVKIKNKKWVEPFEIVTKIFGLPRYDELDPTPYLGPFFVIFFGFCLTDAGYGLVLFLTMFLAVMFLPSEKETKNMMKLLAMGGISTIVMGILFGGYFGITPEQVPEYLTYQTADGRILFQGQLFDSMNDLTGRVMIFAYGLGFVHLLLGIILSGINKINNGKTAEAMQTSFYLAFCILFYVVFAILNAIGVSESLAANLKYIAIALTVLLVWFMGYGQKIYLRIPAGIMGIINEAMSWLSNILSYSRLFALGLATGIIATIFNQLAGVFGGMLNNPENPSIFGLILSIIVGAIIILFGHSINIALNLLGAFIHSGRLQFVEFFGKFAEFGGKDYTPLSRRSKYLFTDKS